MAFSLDLRDFLGCIERLVPDPSNRGRIWPYDVGVVDDRNLLGFGHRFLLLVREPGKGSKQGQAEHKTKQKAALATANPIFFYVTHGRHSPHAKLPARQILVTSGTE